MQQTETVLREKKVMEITGLSRTTIWRQEKKGNFPQRRKISERAIGWLRSEITRWLEDRKIVGAE